MNYSYLEQVKYTNLSHGSTQKSLRCTVQGSGNEETSVGTAVDSDLSTSSVFFLHEILAAQTMNMYPDS